MDASDPADLPWRDPLEVLLALADAPWSMGMISGGPRSRWSYVLAEPDETLILTPEDRRDPFVELGRLAGPVAPHQIGGPPFQGGVAGLASYELGDRVEHLGLPRKADWPDLACGRYASVLAFDHRRQRVLAIGPRAKGWLERTSPTATPLAIDMNADDPAAYEALVARIVTRIRAGEIFQANLARRWTGSLSPGARPADLLAKLGVESPAPFAAYFRLPGLAVVSNSPERFVRVRTEDGALVATTEPIKGTAPRGSTPEEDQRLSQTLAASEKDRAENLMIVDLMRNDLARVCTPGQVRTPDLFRIASFANVHHLVSTVTGRLAPGRSAIDLLRAAFPPGSITGAPKVQAMKVIAEYEPPRGPFFGSIFHLAADGGFDSNVLIRTAAFTETPGGWDVEIRAGAGIVADSDPETERRETEAKISALASALTGQANRPA